MDINKNNIQQEVFEASVPVIIDFYSDTCNPCRLLAPVLDEIEKDYGSKLKICRINVNENADIAQSYSIMAVPTLIYVNNGEEINRTTGLVDSAEILKNLNL